MPETTDKVKQNHKKPEESNSTMSAEIDKLNEELNTLRDKLTEERVPKTYTHTANASYFSEVVSYASTYSMIIKCNANGGKTNIGLHHLFYGRRKREESLQEIKSGFESKVKDRRQRCDEVDKELTTREGDIEERTRTLEERGAILLRREEEIERRVEQCEVNDSQVSDWEKELVARKKACQEFQQEELSRLRTELQKNIDSMEEDAVQENAEVIGRLRSDWEALKNKRREAVSNLLKQTASRYHTSTVFKHGCSGIIESLIVSYFPLVVHITAAREPVHRERKMAHTRTVGPMVVFSLVILLAMTAQGYHLGDTHVDNNIICISPAIKPPLGCMCNVTTSDNIVTTPTCDQSILEEVCVLFLIPKVKNLLEALVVNTEISNSPSECLASSFYLDGRLVSCTDSLGLQLGDENNPAHSCRDIHIACRGYERGLADGFYWIKTRENRAVQAFCDMTHGGWTMVGKIGGKVGDIHGNWLVANHNTRDLQYPRVIADGTYASMDARMLAIDHADEILMSNGDNDHGVGSRWVKWQLPEGRTAGSLWNHSVQSSVPDKLTPVVVTSWDGEKTVCYQNKYGGLPRPGNVGVFPGLASDRAGTVDFSDRSTLPYNAVRTNTRFTLSARCVAVGVIEEGDTEGFDTDVLHTPIPRDGRRRHANFVSIWLK
uniref:Fibrinogen C-terminal domain-containing protein n=1 Tax=Branchiostoma floridae TaxID=7739 RepID=C3Z5I6_BRAFL|eukprot:XP_002596087.1 hypothetical protein BRAFLDRAFT_118056 [Branchiostoma floridae]